MNKRGQSIIEYTLIAVLVILGVVVMGPYVLRSVGAHFKLWDDGIKDSFEDTLPQVPVSAVPIINSNCSCWTVDNGCGNTQGIPCQPGYDGSTLYCNPAGCNHDPISTCTASPACCSTWNNVMCGTVALPAGGVPADYDGTPPQTGNCYYGYELQSLICPSNPASRCVLASSLGISCSLPGCTGTLPSNALFCSTQSTTAPTGLSTNTPIGAPLANLAACPGNSTCQIYCDTANGYSLNGTTCVSGSNPTTPQAPCGYGCSGPNVFQGLYTGLFSSTPGNSGNMYVSVDCPTDQAIGGICINLPGAGRNPQQSGYNPCYIPSSYPNSIYCNFPGTNYTFYQDGISGISYTMSCSATNQLVSINSSSKPAATSGCNWTGDAYIQDFGWGNDMHLFCTSGNLSLFQSDGCGGNRCPVNGSCPPP